MFATIPKLGPPLCGGPSLRLPPIVAKAVIPSAARSWIPAFAGMTSNRGI